MPQDTERKYHMNRSIFLTSCGLSDKMKDSLLDVCGKAPEDLKVLLIPTAGIESDGAREGLPVCLDEFRKMGIRPENVLVYNLELIPSIDYKRTYSAFVENPAMIARLLSPAEAEEFDVCFVTGGDVNVLCREMRRTGAGTVLKAAVSRGLVYVGISAGSMFAAGNMEDGLNLIPNRIIPHQDGMRELPRDGRDILLSDGHAVCIFDDRVFMM